VLQFFYVTYRSFIGRRVSLFGGSAGLKFCAAELMFGLVELDFRFGGGGNWFVGVGWGGGGWGFYLIHLVGLSLGCTPIFGFVPCLEVP
jgi:hypothetical protein